MIRYLNIHHDKIDIVPCGVDGKKFKPEKNRSIIENSKKKYSIKGEYFLYLGTLEPRKNLVRLIEAYSKLKANNNNIPNLILAGRKGWLYEEIFKCIHRLELEKSVVYIGYVAEEDSVPIICGATAFLFPSLYEGFGLPPLEAMACGTPVLTSNVSSLPEVVGDAALLVDPLNVNDICQKLEALISDDNLRQKLIERGMARASLFSWDNAAIKLMEIYKQII
jgi:glycosyltransferase involved in cell wall biosynthesis